MKHITTICPALATVLPNPSTQGTNKTAHKEKYKHTARYGGDYNKSRFVLIPLKDLFKRENTKHVRKEDDD